MNEWKKSSRCETSACVEVFRKSSYSSDSFNCVEVADLPDGAAAVRHSKHPDGPVLVFTADEWAAFTAGVKDGEFDE